MSISGSYNKIYNTNRTSISDEKERISFSQLKKGLKKVENIKGTIYFSADIVKNLKKSEEILKQQGSKKPSEKLKLFDKIKTQMKLKSDLASLAGMRDNGNLAPSAHYDEKIMPTGIVNDATSLIRNLAGMSETKGKVTLDDLRSHLKMLKKMDDAIEIHHGIVSDLARIRNLLKSQNSGIFSKKMDFINKIEKELKLKAKIDYPFNEKNSPSKHLKEKNSPAKKTISTLDTEKQQNGKGTDVKLVKKYIRDAFFSPYPNLSQQKAVEHIKKDELFSSIINEGKQITANLFNPARFVTSTELDSQVNVLNSQQESINFHNCSSFDINDSRQLTGIRDELSKPGNDPAKDKSIAHFKPLLIRNHWVLFGIVKTPAGNKEAVLFDSYNYLKGDEIALLKRTAEACGAGRFFNISRDLQGNAPNACGVFVAQAMQSVAEQPDRHPAENLTKFADGFSAKTPAEQGEFNRNGRALLLGQAYEQYTKMFAQA